MEQKKTFQQLFFISILSCIVCSFHLLKSINIPIFIKKIPILYFYYLDKKYYYIFFNY